MLTLDRDPLQPGPEDQAWPIAASELSNLIEALETEEDLLELLRSSARLAQLSRRASDPGRLLPALRELASIDTFATLAAMESLATLRHTGASDDLVRLLDHPVEIVRRHAAWRLGDRPPQPGAHRRLATSLAVGGIETMHAQRTLRSWSSFDGPAVVEAIVEVLDRVADADARARLIDGLGVLNETDAKRVLIDIALDSNEPAQARIAAIQPLGDRPGGDVERALLALTKADDEIGVYAALALADLSASALPPKNDGRTGLRLAQLTLAGELDGPLSEGGRGDTGGVASLLVSLGQALARHDNVAHVLTIGRGSPRAVLAEQRAPIEEKLSYGRVAYGARVRPPTSVGDSWEHLSTIERGIIRVLRNRPAADVLHLRMADVGALAGIGAARSLGIATCFSLAPDPHGVIRSLQDKGELDRKTFTSLATDNHFWFRARLVERLAKESPQIARFPRSRSERFFDTAGDRSVPPRQRSMVIPEGIDVTLIDRAERSVAALSAGSQPVGGVLAELASMIPTERRHLPLLLSVGRFHPIKGMDRVAGAWGSDPELYESCNLVLVGGSVTDPTPIERSVFDAIRLAVPDHSPAAPGLSLLGGRPREDVAMLMAATASGLPGFWAPGGTYVDGAHKEEFGLALIEALAAGLVVTAPSVGGPPTYIEHGVTGMLVDPGAELGPAVREAMALVDRPGRAERAKGLVADQYSIDTMAERLVELYSPQPALL